MDIRWFNGDSSDGQWAKRLGKGVVSREAASGAKGGLALRSPWQQPSRLNSGYLHLDSRVACAMIHVPVGPEQAGVTRPN